MIIVRDLNTAFVIQQVNHILKHSLDTIIGGCFDDIEFKNNIQIKPNDEKYYNIYEEIMVTEINKFIDGFKQEVSKQAKEDAKNKQIKRKKGY